MREVLRQRAARLTALLGIELPIIGAPMAGATTPALVAAVSNAGGLGSLAFGMTPADAIAPAIAAVRAATDKPFAANVFITPRPESKPRQMEAMRAYLARYRAELGLPEPALPTSFAPDFDAQFDAVLAARVPVVSFTFGALERACIDALHAQGAKVIGTATCVKEARILQELGCDGIAVQGFEAGAHRGSFAVSLDDAQVGLFALLPQVAAAVSTPLIGAGGVMTGAQIAAALMLGASGAQIGTALLRTPESAIVDAYKAALAQATEVDTRITRAFSGRHARGLRNRWMEEVDASGVTIPDYPIQVALTMDIRAAAVRAQRAEFLPLWAGQAASLARAEPAADVVRRLRDELAAFL